MYRVSPSAQFDQTNNTPTTVGCVCAYVWFVCLLKQTLICIYMDVANVVRYYEWLLRHNHYCHDKHYTHTYKRTCFSVYVYVCVCLRKDTSLCGSVYELDSPAHLFACSHASQSHRCLTLHILHRCLHFGLFVILEGFERQLYNLTMTRRCCCFLSRWVGICGLLWSWIMVVIILSKQKLEKLKN